jgi:DNA-binding LacI/PurR family transcriptional regulator
VWQTNAVTVEPAPDDSGNFSPTRRVTSADVARESGVSRATVSYVLNDKPGKTISPRTRALVRETADRLGFSPSAAARSLRSGRSDLVLVLFPSGERNAVNELFVDTLSKLLLAGGLTMLVYYGPPSKVWRAVTPRAIITGTPLTAEDRRELTQAGIPILTTGELSKDAESQYLSVQEQIGRLQVEHLVSAGHTRIGYATTASPGLSYFAVPRLSGVLLECAERGLPAPMLATVDLDIEAARPNIVNWCRQKPKVTAVAAYNDEVALAVLAAAQLEGVHVPHDIAIMGVDDILAARLVVPPLTTVAIGVEAEARYLAATILGTADGLGGAAERPALQLSVVSRGSV